MRKNNTSCIALDYGTKKTGIAYSVDGFAFAWKTVHTRELETLLPKIIAEKNASMLVVGMPYHIDGSMSPHGKRVQDFIEKIRGKIAIPLIVHDERLSTSEARIAFAEYDVAGDIDAEAARLILESYLAGN